MIKSLFIGLNVIGILLLGFLDKNEVTVSQNLPDSLGPGEEYLVEVLVDKPDIMGFAKFQISVEEGLIIEPVQTAGASFTFSENKAKFIWIALPSAKSFTLSYRIIADQNTAGSSRVDSRFSYIYESERKNYDLISHEILLNGNGGELVTSDSDAMTSSLSNETATAFVERTVEAAGSNQWRVNLNIVKSDLNGFAKIEETIPEGYTAIDLKASNAVFSMENETVKYIWYDIPTNKSVNVTYKLLPVVAAENESPKIQGNFSYLVKDETIMIPINAPGNEDLPLAQESITDTGDALIAEVTTEAEDVQQEEKEETTATVNNISNEVETTAITKVETKEEPQKEPEPVLASAVEEAPKVSTTQKSKPAIKAKTKSINPLDPQEGVFYRVQIAAGRSSVRTETFTSLYNFKENLILESHEGWFKYTTGYHDVYKSARDDRDRISNEYEKFKGPFVTAYNDGERITVQEALMITSQNWYQ